MIGRARSFVIAAVLAAAPAACAPDEGGDAEAEAAAGEGALAADDLVLEGQLRGFDLPDGTLHLTYDDGPGARTVELVDYLTGQGIEATFFINGVYVPGRQRALSAIVEQGHLLANHTQNHRLLPRETTDEAMREIAATDAIILGAQPDRPLFLRTPYAGWNGDLHRAISRSPMNKYVGPVHWDIGTKTTSSSAADWDCWAKGIPVERCGDLYLAEIRAKRRGIVLLHDLHGRTVDMTKYLVPKLVAEGFRFATLEDVPSIRRATATPRPALGPDECYSGTLHRVVSAGACVESSADRRLYRCARGDWKKTTANDARCVERFSLP